MSKSRNSTAKVKEAYSWKRRTMQGNEARRPRHLDRESNTSPDHRNRLIPICMSVRFEPAEVLLNPHQTVARGGRRVVRRRLEVEFPNSS